MATGGPIDEIKSKLDIVDVVSDYLSLKKAGTSHKARCPFHHEKTASFFVSQDKQIWHCFGCGEGGDIFGFVSKMEGLEFVDALRLLARKAGVTLRKEDSGLHSERNRLLEANRWAAKFFHEVLMRSPKAEAARRYVKGRALTRATIEDFLIGYAPDSWDATMSFLKKKGFKEEELFKAGLIQRKERGTGHFDRFRNRVMFPIQDVHGNVVGFTGRVLPDAGGHEQKAAKYINTQQTLVYNKSRVLYGLDKAKQHIRKNDAAVIVEGNMDVIASHQAGVMNVVASSGTALTEDQLHLLNRFTDRLIFSFDEDLAGENAALRGIEMAIMHGLSARVLILPLGKDPDDCIRQDPEAWKKAIESSVPYMEWLIRKTKDRLDLNDSEAKKRASDMLLKETAKLPDAVERSHWLHELSDLFRTPEKMLMEKMEKFQKSPTKVQNKAENGPSSSRDPKSRSGIITEYVLGFILSWPEYAEGAFAVLKPEYLDEEFRELYRDFIIFYNDKRHSDAGVLSFRVSSEQSGNTNTAKRAAMLELRAEKEFGELAQEDRREALVRLIGEIKELYISRRKRKLMQAMASAEKSGDAAQIESIERQIGELMM